MKYIKRAYTNEDSWRFRLKLRFIAWRTDDARQVDWETGEWKPPSTAQTGWVVLWSLVGLVIWLLALWILFDI